MILKSGVFMLSGYLYLLLAMALFLQGGTAFLAAINVERKRFTPFLIYSGLLGASFLAGLFSAIPQLTAGILLTKMILQLAAFFFLAEFTFTCLQCRWKTKLFWHLILLAAVLTSLHLTGGTKGREIITLCVTALPFLPFSAIMLWRTGNVYPNLEAAFKIASVFHLGNGAAILSTYLLRLRTLPRDFQFNQEMGLILIGFSLFCTLACAFCFLLTLRTIDFPTRKNKQFIFALIPAAFLLFAGAGALVPAIFQYYGEEVAYIRARNNAELLMKDLIISINRVENYARELARNKTVHQILEQGEVNGSILGNNHILEKFTASKLQIVCSLLNTAGLCIDSSNKASLLYNLTGQDLSFSEYFRQAMRFGESRTLAPDLISGLPGIFAAVRVDNAQGKPIGVAVARRNISFALDKFNNSYAALISPGNTVFFTNTERLSTKQIKWEHGLRWFCMEGEVEQDRYSNGIIFTERSCNFLTIPGWRLVLGIPTLQPVFFHLIGQFFLLLLWVLTLCVIGIYIIQKKMQIQLLQHSSWRDTVFNSNTAGIIVADMNRNVIDANETITKMLGYTTEDLKKLGIEAIYPNEGVEHAFLEQLSRSFSEGKAYENPEICLRRKNGSQAIFKIAGNCFHNKTAAAGLPIQGVVWTITDQTRALLEINALKESEKMYRALVESTTEHIFMLDTHGFFLYSNNKQIRSAMQENSTPIHLHDVYDSATTALYTKMLETVFNGGHQLSFQHTVKNQDGSILVMVVLYPIRKDSIIYAAGGIARDITTFRVQGNSLG